MTAKAVVLVALVAVKVVVMVALVQFGNKNKYPTLSLSKKVKFCISLFFIWCALPGARLTGESP